MTESVGIFIVTGPACAVIGTGAVWIVVLMKPVGPLGAVLIGVEFHAGSCRSSWPAFFRATGLGIVLLGFFYRNNIAFKKGSIQIIDGIECHEFIAHLYKTKAPGHAGRIIVNNLYGNDLSKLRKYFSKIGDCGLRVEISDKKVHNSTITARRQFFD